MMEDVIKEPDFEVIKTNLFNLKQRNRSDNNGKIDAIFKSFDYDNLKFKNHFAFINLTDDEFYDNGLINDKYHKFYANLSTKSVGLIVTGGVDVCNKQTVKNLVSNESVYRHKNLTNIIKCSGCKIFFQLKAQMGRSINNNQFLNCLNYSSSFNRDYNNCNNISVRISDSKCNEIVENIKEVSSFVKKANYDGIYINLEITNLFGEFLSDEFNRRKFGYYQDGFEFIEKIINAINMTGKKPKMMLSVTVDSLFYKTLSNNIKYIKTAKNITKSSNFNKFAEILRKYLFLGVDGFLFKFGCNENEYFSNFNTFESNNLFLDYYIYLKEYISENNLKTSANEYPIIIYYDNISDKLGLENKLVIDNQIQFIDITKNLLSDTNYIKNLRSGLAYNKCIKCSYCNKIANFSKVRCAINPNIFDEIKPCNKNKLIAVVGAGIAGIVCSNYLAEKGFKIELFDKNNVINKNGKLNEIFGFDKSICEYNSQIENELNENILKENICLFLNKTFSVNKNINNYDAIIVATGYFEKLLELNGSVLKIVHSIYDAIDNQNIFMNKNKIFIYAKGEISLKLALYLSTIGKSVTIIFNDLKGLFLMPNSLYTYYFYEIYQQKIDVYFLAKVKRIETDFVEFIANKCHFKENLISISLNLRSKYNYKYEPKLISKDLDLFIYEPDLIPNNSLFYDIVNSNYKGKVFMIGAASKIGSFAEYVNSAYFVAKNL